MITKTNKAVKWLVCAALFTIHYSLFTSCSDMLEVDSTRQVTDPDLDSMTDSMSYALGVLHAMQELADVYVIQNEMRGDMAALTAKADTNLVDLSNYAVKATNKYDSAYVYYNVINNCNYYLAHRDSTLSEKGRNVVINEYAAVAAIRAWAYLQAVRQFGKVRFFLHPLTKVSEVDNAGSLPLYDIDQVITALLTETDIERFKGLAVPNYGGNFGFSYPNFGGSEKRVDQRLFFIPVDVILGDLYLERGNGYADYRKAADYYWNYIYTNSIYAKNYYSELSSERIMQLESQGVTIPEALFSSIGASGNWSDIFETNSTQYVLDSKSGTNDIVSCIPLAVNKVKGVTSDLPRMFGYDYYAIHADSVYIGNQIQIVPSKAYNALSDSCLFYYIDNTTDATGNTRSAFKAGDMRRWEAFGDNRRNRQDTCQYFIKYQSANVYLYRISTIYMHLAEALNRMGHPDAAFAVLKDGLSYNLVNSMNTQKQQYAYYMAELATMTDADSIATFQRLAADAIRNVYLSDTTCSLLTSTIPFASVSYRSVFDANHGIHTHGSSDRVGSNYGAEGIHSAYQYRLVVPAKMAEIASTFGVTIPATAADTLAAQIDAVEDLLCDEYALEFTLEGSRFSDLTRMARHKNKASIYGANYGGRWFDRKIRATRPGVKDLTQESSWYLPFQ